MSREIKFRAIHKGNTEFDYYHNWEVIRALARFAEYDYLMVINQYTGLKDKNGREIFEGDVLTNSYGKQEVVIFHENGYYGQRSKNGHTVTNNLLKSYLENKVVSGNIHENPELINQ